MTKGEMVERLRKGMQRSEAWSTFWSDEDADRLVRAVLTELKAIGLAVVPREPTEEMIEAMPHMSDVGHEIWRNALSASPYD